MARFRSPQELSPSVVRVSGTQEGSPLPHTSFLVNARTHAYTRALLTRASNGLKEVCSVKKNAA